MSFFTIFTHGNDCICILQCLLTIRNSVLKNITKQCLCLQLKLFYGENLDKVNQLFRMNQESNCRDIDQDIFMQIFKYYKSNRPKPSLDQVLATECDHRLSKVKSCIDIEDARSKYLGLQSLKDWRTYLLCNHPGLIIIKNPFTSLGQRFWIRKCLELYPKKPNKTNIDIERNINDWWSECHISEDNDKKLLKKLRWTTLGYHHNWDTKLYTEFNKGIFPKDLAELSDVVAYYLNYKQFRAEAAIVNYYHMGSTLSAHTDHSEVNLEAPLFSFSFGQSAIFLIGGRDKSKEPCPILINSGDIIVMSKEARLCYHAVPKILPSSTKPWNDLEGLERVTNSDIKLKLINYDILREMNQNIDNVEWSKFSSYVDESRININVRQVLKENQSSLNEMF